MNMTLGREGLATELRLAIAEIAEVDSEEIGPKTEFMSDLDMDSLMALELLAMLEKRYGIQIPEELLPSLNTLEGVVEVVVSQAQEAGG